MIASVHSSSQAARRTPRSSVSATPDKSKLRSPPPKPKTRFDRPPVPPLPLQFVKPQPQSQPQSSVQPAPEPQAPKSRPQPPRRDPHRHDHLVDFRPRAGPQYQFLKCKLIHLNEARQRASIVYHSVQSYM
ncbi:hypothetical protein BC628DRAFT_1423535 [Trametes gibbosa]|nr:hypothetical protein BC628DRAFT_1423532 [Trametes gibbosa]KAI0819703.1 hypothetical protein BC628DRAFT_1423535 [Trametes gibbosa]